MSSRTRVGGPLARRILLIVVLVMAPIALALVSQRLAATADPPKIDDAPVQVELRPAGAGGGGPSDPSTTTGPEVVPADPADELPEDDDDAHD